MLSGLILENFKAFGGRRVIPIRPITLVFGPNSAGKSAILQSLLLLKQTMFDQDAGDEILRISGSLVDLGRFQDLVFRNEYHFRSVEISMIFDRISTSSEYFTALGQDIDESGLRGGIGVRTRFNQKAKRQILDSLPVYLGDISEPSYWYGLSENDIKHEIFLSYDFESLEPIDFDASLDGLDHDGFKSLDSSMNVYPKINEKRDLWKRGFETFISRKMPELIEEISMVDYYEWRQYLEQYFGVRYMETTTDPVWELGRRFENYTYPAFLEDVASIFNLVVGGPPYRRRFWIEPQSLSFFYPVSDLSHDIELRKEVYRHLVGSHASVAAPNLWGVSVELTQEMKDMLEGLIYLGPLRDFPERQYFYGGSSPSNVGKSGQLLSEVLLSRPSLIDELNRTLDTFQIGYRLEVVRFSADGIEDLSSLRLRDMRQGISVSLRDVGFGVSQVLPVLVQCQTAKNQVVLIEQPEIHLHPRLQAELGDIFIKSALGEDKNTFIVETHSEHLVLRIMRRLRDTSRGTLPEGVPPIRPSDVAIIYVQPTSDGSIPLVMDLDEEGQLLTAWPNGFFEEGFRERFA